MHIAAHEAQPPSRTALRVIVVTALALFMCVWHLPDLARVFGQPLGDWGFRTDGRVIFYVAPGGPAERAGLRGGDAIDLSANDPREIDATIGNFAVWPNDRLIVKVHRGRDVRVVSLRAGTEPAAFLPMVFLRELLFIVPLLVGVMLVLLRPNLTTWGLFLYAVSFANAPTAIADWRLFSPAGARILDDVGVFCSYVLGNAGLVLFAFTLSRPTIAGWRAGMVALAALLGTLQLIPIVLYGPTWMPRIWTHVTVDASVAVSVLAMLGLLDSYLHVPLRFKQRLKWIGAGLLLGTAAFIADALLWPNYESYAAHTFFSVVLSMFPLIAAYGLLRERVVDINFAISRTLVYGLLTASIVAAFALIDYFFSKVLEQARLSLPVDILVALGLGFSFHNVHGKVDHTVDRVLFRKRYRNEVRLAKAANAVLHVNAAETVASFLVKLPAEVLDLTGAALYRIAGKRFELVARAGWSEQVPATLDADDPLVVYVSAELVPIRLSDVPMREHAPGRGEAPVLALPLVLRRELVGFVLYGAHRNGADLDSDEERALVPLVNNAMVTYDHLEAVSLREELRRLRSLGPGVALG